MEMGLEFSCVDFERLEEIYPVLQWVKTLMSVSVPTASINHCAPN